MDARFGHVDLMFADGRDGGENLSVDICQTDAVVIDDVYGSHTAAGEHLDDVASYASDTENGHPRPVQSVDGGLAKK